MGSKSSSKFRYKETHFPPLSRSLYPAENPSVDAAGSGKNGTSPSRSSPLAEDSASLSKLKHQDPPQSILNKTPLPENLPSPISNRASQAPFSTNLDENSNLPPSNPGAPVTHRSHGSLPTAPAATVRSFADSVREGTNKRPYPQFFNQDSLKIGSVTSIDGIPAVVFSREEEEKLAEPFRHTLVGKFSFGRPSISAIQRYLENMGCISAKVHFFNQRHALLFLGSSEDFTKVWLHRELVIEGFPMRLFKWSPDFDVHQESSVAPVWVRFTGLPLHCYESQALFAIGGLLGTPLKIDEPTKTLSRFSYARICIEMDLRTKPPEEICVVRNGKTVKIAVVYERLPNFCGHCKHLGHGESNCYIKTNGPRPRRKRPIPREPSSVQQQEKSMPEGCIPSTETTLHNKNPVAEMPAGEGPSGLSMAEKSEVRGVMDDFNSLNALVPFEEGRKTPTEESGTESDSFNSDSESEEVEDHNIDSANCPALEISEKPLPIIKAASSPHLKDLLHSPHHKVTVQNHDEMKVTKSRTTKGTITASSKQAVSTRKSARARHK